MKNDNLVAVETELLAHVERHLAAWRVAPSAFGRAVMRDPRFVSDLRAGRSLRPAIHSRVVAYLASFDQGRG